MFYSRHARQIQIKQKEYPYQAPKFGMELDQLVHQHTGKCAVAHYVADNCVAHTRQQILKRAYHWTRAGKANTGQLDQDQGQQNNSSWNQETPGTRPRGSLPQCQWHQGQRLVSRTRIQEQILLLLSSFFTLLTSFKSLY